MDAKQTTRVHTVDHGFIDYDPSVPCISGTCIGFMTSSEFRAFMEQGLDLIREKTKEHGKLGWLADTSKADAFVPDDTEWCVNTWNPAAYNAGVRYCAFVVPESAFSQMSIEEYSEKTSETGAIVVNHFSDLESAREWLREVLGNS